MTMQLDIDSIIKAIKTVIPQDQKSPFALHEPCFRGNEWAYVKDCIDSTWVFYVGKYVDRFEAMIAEFTGVKKAVAVVNGTAALQIALKLAKTLNGQVFRCSIPSCHECTTRSAANKKIDLSPFFHKSSPGTYTTN